MLRKYLFYCLISAGLAACCSCNQAETDEPPFEIHFEMERLENGENLLHFSIALDSGFYYVSPHSEGFHQQLRFSIEETDSLILQGELLEDPIAQEEYDQWTDKEGRFVRKKTTYSQKLLVNTPSDFEVRGLIWLSILPIHQPYEINYSILHQSDQLSVEHMRITTSDFPTFWDKKSLDGAPDVL